MISVAPFTATPAWWIEWTVIVKYTVLVVMILNIPINEPLDTAAVEDVCRCPNFTASLKQLLKFSTLPLPLIFNPGIYVAHFCFFELSHK
jgi:hypothetical protein